MTEHTGVEPSRDSLGANGPGDDAATPPPPPGVETVFGERSGQAQQYVDFLSTAGLERGLMGPRERPRLWDRHVLNSAAAACQLADGESVVDIGSGAGLPGIPLALARPDLQMTLVEPLLRRVTFLEEIIDSLGIDVRVIRGRAEDKAVIAEAGEADVVTSRAVAPLAKLAGWSAPLLRVGGQMVALKGSSAVEEIERDRVALARLGFTNTRVEVVSAPDAEETRLVIATLGTRMGGRGARSRGSAKRRR
ncbi:16S rRNA (guanine(527)-N(7))-methyltransferase RsmG [Dietzia aurantiaca]|uniref:16S rRNA (guanine(527)-N(7))-methyltransferase RsmG n=1 Tax=Dietzia aurantiaca TaxID=983873 RepID=UPI001E60E8D7|nr:16S rRNA (guanine(527)-N(7))-methyltransferase RsmG [Dietzia aurantiaca]MCD2262572.1 16S rRNA (guanine(527)-N(7))-methyltransferase RsmG [Dietzia aurantiaca]